MPTLDERIKATQTPSGWPVMRQEWRHLLFLHWTVEARDLQGLLPRGLDLDTYEGKAYVGLVPFTIRATRSPLPPAVPVLPGFHEVNLRTYVHRGGREPGVWFFSLDAASRAAVLGARAWFRLPYHFASIRMDVEGVDDPAVTFESQRRWPGPRPAGCSLRYRPRGPEVRAQPGTLEYFLLERYILYAEGGGVLRQGRVAHEPYPLRAGEAEGEETLSAAAQVPSTRGDRLVHYSGGVSVRIDPPRSLR